MAGEESIFDLSAKIALAFNVPPKPLGDESDWNLVSEAEVEYEAESVQDALRTLGFSYDIYPLRFDCSIEDFVSAIRCFNPDVIINLCEGAFGKSYLEMNVAATFEIMGIQFTGSPALTLGLCQDKGLTKDILKANGIVTPAYRVLEDISDWRREIDFPLFVKPLREDASLGISKKSFVKNKSELKSQLEYIRSRYRQPALVEEYIDGRELNVTILGNSEPSVLPISEISFEFTEEPKIVDYSAKWFKESEEYWKTKPICPAKLDTSMERKIEKTALAAYRILHCRDYARVDIRLRNGVPFVLEVNPNPDISPDAGVARSLNASGISYEEFIRRIVSFALSRKKMEN